MILYQQLPVKNVDIASLQVRYLKEYLSNSIKTRLANSE